MLSRVVPTHTVVMVVRWLRNQNPAASMVRRPSWQALRIGSMVMRCWSLSCEIQARCVRSYAMRCLIRTVRQLRPNGRSTQDTGGRRTGQWRRSTALLATVCRVNANAR